MVILARGRAPMAHDVKLVEIVAKEIAIECGDDYWQGFIPAAERTLDAINAGGTHWVAPREAAKAMVKAAIRAGSLGAGVRHLTHKLDVDSSARDRPEPNIEAFAPMPDIIGLFQRPVMMNRDDAREFLARELQWKFEHLDPDEGDWNNLSDRDKEYYRQLVNWLLLHREAILAALA